MVDHQAFVRAPSVGLGLRPAHYGTFGADPPPVDFWEVHSENYFGDGGAPLTHLEGFRRDYPVSLHGVGLSLGSADPLSTWHLSHLKALVDRIDPFLVSDHLAWVGARGFFLHDLLPIVHDEPGLRRLSARIDQVQSALARPILVENLSAYWHFSHSSLSEAHFLSELSKRSGCKILLDINNIYVNARNHGTATLKDWWSLAPECVGEIHLAGFEEGGAVVVDTHSRPVSDAVWGLYGAFLRHWGKESVGFPTTIEWDSDLPEPLVLLQEWQKAKRLAQDMANAWAASTVSKVAVEGGA